MTPKGPYLYHSHPFTSLPQTHRIISLLESINAAFGQLQSGLSFTADAHDLTHAVDIREKIHTVLRSGRSFELKGSARLQSALGFIGEGALGKGTCQTHITQLKRKLMFLKRHKQTNKKNPCTVTM